MNSRYDDLIQGVKRKLGPLAWGSLIVFVIYRTGDIGNFLARLVIGRFLPELDFGAFDPLFSVIVFLSIPLTVMFRLGVKSISRLRARGKHAESRALALDLIRMTIVGSVLVAGVVFLMRSFILSRLHLDSYVYVVIICCLFLLNWWQPLYNALIQGARNYRALSIPVIINPFLILICTVVLVSGLSFGLVGALWARVLAGSLTTAVVFIVLRGFLRGKRERYSEELEVMRKALVPMTVQVVSVVLLTNFDKLYVRNFLLQDSGGYGALITFGRIPSYFIAPIIFVLFPLAAAEHASGRTIARFFRQALAIGTFVTAVFVIGFWIFARPLMGLWKDAFIPYASHLWLYSLAMGLTSLIQIVVSVEMARHRYGFLWFLAIPTIGMCALLYLVRPTWNLREVLIIITVTRVVILLGVAVFGVMTARRYAAREEQIPVHQR